MNADLQKLRESRLFRKLPDRAFDRVLKHIKVRAYERGEEILKPSSTGEFARTFGYIVSGRVIFLSGKNEPIGLSFQDEFFLGRRFTIEGRSADKLVSIHDRTLVVFIPKEVIETLVSASRTFSEIVEDIYDSIFERAQWITKENFGPSEFESLMKPGQGTQLISSWVVELEGKAKKKKAETKPKKKRSAVTTFLWLLGFSVAIFFVWESLARYYELKISPLYFVSGQLGGFGKQENFNIWMGVVGYVLILLTNLHTFAKFAIRRFKWKINYKSSGQFHIFFGLVGGILVLLHTAGHLKGQNIAHFAVYFLIGVLISGLIGQLISSRIPKTITGDKMKLNNILKDQEKMKKKAEILMDDDQFKTSVNLMARPLPNSFWVNLFSAPLIWFRTRRLRGALQKLGLGKDSAQLAAGLVAKEFELRQKIRTLEVANIFFKRWMWIHIPLGYILFIAGGLHIFLVYYQGLLENFLK